MKNKKNNLKKQNRYKGSLYVGLASLLSLYACSNSPKYETITKYEPTKGVITTIEETKKDSFSIIDEKLVDDKNASRIIVKYLDGRLDTMNLDRARALVSPQDTSWTADNGHAAGYHPASSGHGLGGAIWWGAMGYMMGRNMSSPVYPGFYRYQEENRRGGYYSGGGSSGVSRSSYTSVGDNLKSSSKPTTISRPISGGRSGFFGGWKGSSGG